MITLLKNSAVINNYSKSLFSPAESRNAHAFHKTFTNYSAAPLIELNGLSKKLGVSRIWLKDESRRFDLNAFKVLGASYAIARFLCEQIEYDVKNISFSLFNKPEIRELIKNYIITTATDGNHGRGVAWTARQLGCKCVVFMPKGTARARVENIKLLSAEVHIVDGSYDEAVSLAKINSEKSGWILVQDSSWDGYEKIPRWIMQGYFTMLEEISEQLKNENPTHIFVQCGVGSLPAVVVDFFIQKYHDDKPVIIIVEPDDAACFYESVKNNKIVPLKNEMRTIMAGLSCGTPSKLAFDILKVHSDFFIKCSDDVTVKGMQILGRNEFGDSKIISGESGAVTTGLIYFLLSDEKNKYLSQELQLTKNSKILLFSTEGNTDPDMYGKIVTDNFQRGDS